MTSNPPSSATAQDNGTVKSRATVRRPAVAPKPRRLSSYRRQEEDTDDDKPTDMTWDSPLKGYENAEPLPDKVNPDGKSLYNPPGPRSEAYEKFPEPIKMTNNAFDFHSASANTSILVPCRMLIRPSSLLYAEHS